MKRTLYIGIWIGVGITFVGFAVCESFPDAISRLFTTDETLTTIAREGFRVYFIFYPVVGAQIVIQNFFQSIGKPKISIFLSLTRQLLFLIPFLIVLPRYYGVKGVWASMCGSDLIAFIFALVTVIVMVKRLNVRFKGLKPIEQ